MRRGEPAGEIEARERAPKGVCKKPAKVLTSGTDKMRSFAASFELKVRGRSVERRHANGNLSYGAPISASCTCPISKNDYYDYSGFSRRHRS